MDQYITIDEYIARFPEETRIILNRMRDTIHAAAPEAVEAIRYGIPTFRLHGSNLVHFAGFRTHTSFFPTPSGIEKFRDRLAPYTISKGTVRFPHGTPVPYDLIAGIVRFRVDECLKK
ncbi:MAG: hypothetical protein GYA23_10095 [Methanomicrobiales archaeon]|nr:hypothetical protein [Methanomicrobiales archaeon]